VFGAPLVIDLNVDTVALHSSGVDVPVPPESFLVESLYDALLTAAEQHKTAAEQYPCVPPFSGSYLLRVHAESSFRSLNVVLYTAAQAQFGDAWLLLNDTQGSLQQIPPAQPAAETGSYESCTHDWATELSSDGTLRLQRKGEAELQVEALDKGSDSAQILSLLGEPEWANLSVGIWATPDTSTQEVVDLYSILSLGLGHRSDIALGHHGSPFQEIAPAPGQQVWALPLALGGRAGECLFASELAQCMGRDGVLHDWMGDGCHLNPGDSAPDTLGPRGSSG
jgi:hypothetical protein